MESVGEEVSAVLVGSNVPVGAKPESVDDAVVSVALEVESNVSLEVVVGSEVAPNALSDVVVGSEDVAVGLVPNSPDVMLPKLSDREEVIEPRSEVTPPRIFPSAPDVDEVL